MINFFPINFLSRLELRDSCNFAGWHIALEKALAQSIGHRLMSIPAN
jgi:hypothetical protein